MKRLFTQATGVVMEWDQRRAAGDRRGSCFFSRHSEAPPEHQDPEGLRRFISKNRNQRDTLYQQQVKKAYQASPTNFRPQKAGRAPMRNGRLQSGNRPRPDVRAQRRREGTLWLGLAPCQGAEAQARQGARAMAGSPPPALAGGWCSSLPAAWRPLPVATTPHPPGHLHSRPLPTFSTGVATLLSKLPRGWPRGRHLGDTIHSMAIRGAWGCESHSLGSCSLGPLGPPPAGHCLCDHDISLLDWND